MEASLEEILELLLDDLAEKRDEGILLIKHLRVGWLPLAMPAALLWLCIPVAQRKRFRH